MGMTNFVEGQRTMTDHNWTGWPGARCTVCFIEDPREICLANGHEFVPCPLCSGNLDTGVVKCAECCGTGCIPCNRPECQAGECK